jgi:hypothetical protein
MVSIDDQAFDMFSSTAATHDMHDYSRYPDPPHSASSYGTAHTSPMDMSGGMYALSSSTGFDQQSLYAEATSYMVHHGRPLSPGMGPGDEGSDLRHALTSSSSLSTNSATSSAAASPQSNHSHHMGPGPEWQPHSYHPGIVGNDYLPGSEYAGFAGPGMDECWEYTQPKSFVGESHSLLLRLVLLVLILFPFPPPAHPHSKSQVYGIPPHSISVLLRTWYQ